MIFLPGVRYARYYEVESPAILALRKASDILGSDGNLSKALGRNPGTVCRWLSGKTTAIPFDVPFAIHRLTKGAVDAWDFVEPDQPVNWWSD